MACGEPDNYGVCPNCGYCPHCGRGRQAQPYYPTWPPSPYYTGGWWGVYPPPNTGTCGIATGTGVVITTYGTAYDTADPNGTAS